MRRRHIVTLVAALGIALVVSRATVRLPAKARWLALASAGLAAWGIAGLARAR
jgi:hypothetical protein